MSESIKIEKEYKLVEIRLFDIPEEDWNDYQQIMRAFGHNKKLAFRACLDAYFQSRMYGVITTRLEILENKIKELELSRQKEIIKAFGGGEYVKS